MNRYEVKFRGDVEPVLVEADNYETLDDLSFYVENRKVAAFATWVYVINIDNKWSYVPVL